MSTTQIRTGRFAGSFYPGTELEITRTLDVLRDRAGEQERAQHPPILILPHAGWTYSGFAAVRGLMTLVSSPPSRAVLIGPAHRHYYMGFSLAGYDKYRTPLGDIEVDLKLQAEIADQTDYEFEPEAHESEHSIEVLLPMLQHIVPGELSILPILAGSVSRADINKLADSLAALLNPFSDVLIISSDLSHFFTYDEARSIDQQTLDLILEGSSQELLDQSGEGGKLACGFAGIVVGIELARRWALEKPELLIYYNSGDSGGDRNSVVGYASLAWPPPDLGTEES